MRGCAYVAVTILILVIAFQLAVAAGLPWGSWTQGGQTGGELPAAGRAVALVSAVILLAFGLAVLARIGRGPMMRVPGRVVAVLAWIAVGYSGLAIVLNGASRSSDERLLWLPITVVLFVTILVAVIGTRHTART